MYEKGGKPQEEKPSEENPEQKEQDRPPQNEQTSAEDQLEEHSEQKEQDRPPQNEQTQPRKKRKVQKPPPKNRKVRFAFWIFFFGYLLYVHATHMQLYKYSLSLRDTTGLRHTTAVGKFSCMTAASLEPSLRVLRNS